MQATIQEFPLRVSEIIDHTAVVQRYLKENHDAVDPQGWFDTGDIVFMHEIPHTATGKISRLLLRKKSWQIKDVRCPCNR
ncbi:MAG: hypothetical protein L3J33_00655 [Rhodobacteraceae bacterium]|nr:hypothetical protein [Paracoccaceae bacterium]